MHAYISYAKCMQLWRLPSQWLSPAVESSSSSDDVMMGDASLPQGYDGKESCGDLIAAEWVDIKTSSVGEEATAVTSLSWRPKAQQLAV
jgi:hypothetical protein